MLDDIKEKEEEKVEQTEVKQEKGQKKEMKKVEEKVIKCTVCGETAVFGTAHDQRQHFKTEWHV